ncbi:hypothetical protein [Mangrovicoccus ximenensis]|uniref:hypothetical protein n=1 Tax=Mangrovicoccus ximenensis TaxID=1911570 RepID=UPI000D3730C7|nr:hypothetical protein [Mangrovicoccus ximenensis]
MAAAQFPGTPVAALSCRIDAGHAELPMAAPPVRAAIGDGIRFASRQQDRHAMAHISGRVREGYAIRHRLAEMKHPWRSEDPKMVRGTSSRGAAKSSG